MMSAAEVEGTLVPGALTRPARLGDEHGVRRATGSPGIATSSSAAARAGWSWPRSWAAGWGATSTSR